jgi:peptidoglycan/LPS O-acetylase OafA/YrhL
MRPEGTSWAEPAGRVSRIAYIDGLRGLAVAMVVVYHAWGFNRSPNFALDKSSGFLDVAFSQGKEGVTLFFVISGFCLSYPLLLRRNRGLDRWFRPSWFFTRRCLRILPPYLVALALGTVAGSILVHAHSPVAAVIAPPNATNLLSHIALVHNVTPYIYSGNGSLWSLGVEWQWYWLFPLVLFACISRPRSTTVVLLLLALVSYPVAYDFYPRGLDLVYGSLTTSLCIFALGILAAHAVTSEAIPNRKVLLTGIVLPLILVEGVIRAGLVFQRLAFLPFDPHDGVLALTRPLDGLIFTCLLLLGVRSRVVHRALSFPPLVALGVASYSVYLVQQPIIRAIDEFDPMGPTGAWVVTALAVSSAVVAGYIFHRLVERPCLSPHLAGQATPTLRRLLSWTDHFPMYVIPVKLRPEAPVGSESTSGGDANQAYQPSAGISQAVAELATD